MLYRDSEGNCQINWRQVVPDEQAPRNAALGEKVLDRMKIHCFTLGSLRSLAGDLSNSGWEGAGAFMRAIADALEHEEAAK